MIRQIGTEIEIDKIVKVKEIGVKEEVLTINHDIPNSKIEINTKITNNKEETIKTNYYVFEGEEYQNLVKEDLMIPQAEAVWAAIEGREQ